MSNKFFKQLEAINPGLVVIFERYLYACAQCYVIDYNGGYWQDEVSLGNDTYALRYPGMSDAEVRLVNSDNYTDQMMDPASAGVALTILALNRTLWAVHGAGHEGIAAQISELWERVQDASREDSNSLNVSAIVSFLD